jgi:hypothetical protein
MLIDVSYVAPQVHGIVNVALHREYSPGIVFIFPQGRKDLCHVLRLTQRATLMSTTRLYSGYVNWG